MAPERISELLPFSTDDEQWPLAATLTWIATRSLVFTREYAQQDVLNADALVALARQDAGVPPGPNFDSAFDELCGKIVAGDVRAHADRLKWQIPLEHEAAAPDRYFELAPPPDIERGVKFKPQAFNNLNLAGDRPLRLRDFMFHDGDCLTAKGSGRGSPEPDGARIRWGWRNPSFARSHLLKAWPDWPVFAAWKKAKSQPWSPPRGFSGASLTELAGNWVSLSTVIETLAFFPNRMPIGLNFQTDLAMRLSAGLALLDAAADGKVALSGRATFRLPHHPYGVAPATPTIRLEPVDLRDMTLVIDAAPDWIGPRSFADQYPEQGQATRSVTYVAVSVQTDTLRRWIDDLTGKAPPNKRGRKPKFDWSAIQAEAVRLMDHHGEFSPDDPEWNAQARIEAALFSFCSRLGDAEPSVTQLREYVRAWLSDWRESKK